MFIAYEHASWRETDLALVGEVNDQGVYPPESINGIIEEYRAQGFTLTLRQLYYQLFARAIIKENTERAYKNLGNLVSKARMNGKVDWYAIEDRTRFLRGGYHSSSVADTVKSMAGGHSIDLWKNQPYYQEVWVEKDALVSVLDQACRAVDTNFFSCRGYTSQSEMWAAGRRLMRHRKNGKKVRIIHLGDHDPSGIDMSRDIEDRLTLFSGGRIEFIRIALNKDQIDQYQPPPNPAKLTDSRGSSYVAKYGGESWELDALEPRVLMRLITDTIVEVREEDKWKEANEKQEYEQAQLQRVADNWTDVETFLDGMEVTEHEDEEDVDSWDENDDDEPRDSEEE